jgi:nitrite reductase/ring-hydroxylating ferredoxin subunit
VGVGALGAGGYLGGHLTYAEGVGVDTTVFEDFPEDWTQALADAALGEGEMRAVEIGGAEIVIARSGGRVYALADTCVHRKGSLADGELVGDCVKCPLHGSTFALADGSVEQGPAAYPQPVLEARVNDGSIEVRAPQI